MPSTQSEKQDAYRWSPQALWEMVELKAAQAMEQSKPQAVRLVREFVSPDASDPLDDLLRAVRRRSGNPAQWYKMYLSKGGLDPRSAPPLKVLESLTKLFEMWYPKGGEQDYAPQDE